MDEKSCWSIVAWSSCLCTAASKISRCLFLLFEGSRAPIFAKRWVTVWWNIYTGLAALHCKTVQVGHTNMRYAILPFGKAATFSFLGVQLTATFHQVLEAIHDICDISKHEKQKSHGPSFACHCQWLLALLQGTPVAIAGHQCGCC